MPIRDRLKRRWGDLVAMYKYEPEVFWPLVILFVPFALLCIWHLWIDWWAERPFK